jgi:hypothetical protein
MNNFLKRFFIYQYERFPSLILIFTTYAVVSSTFTVVTGEFRLDRLTIIGITTGLFYTFHMRLFDEFKDFDHDLRYYPGRPVSRGLLTLSELRIITAFVVIVEFVINLFVPLKSLFFFTVAFLYSLLTKKEFFIRDWIRRHFFIYNVTHYLQTSLIVIYFYTLAGANLAQPTRLLWMHFIFTNLTLTLLEWARKMRVRSEENESRDTYSAQLGIVGSSIVLSVISISIFGIFYFIALETNTTGLVNMYGLIGLIIMVTSVLFYAFKQTKIASNSLQLVALIYFVLLHILV